MEETIWFPPWGDRRVRRTRRPRGGAPLGKEMRSEVTNFLEGREVI
ncbi:MAG: hypothetical protein DDT33_01227 [Firmicutes bacterium]|nr:hypothetical protein [Bacillota bacterium]